MAYGPPPPVQQCTNPDHPARRHGHYGYAGHWCTDFNSPLLGEDNGGHIERGWIVLYERSEG
jgi:hypothetical protein